MPSTPDQVPQSADPAAQVAAIRAILAAFEWGSDDLQYALEEIDQIVSVGDEN